ncbi:hypothetical protein HYU06_02525 [Candidatus Woesearchaeota archaeon]|nr:hypothetical protein [Candidatus Woesearchaeota archaeon]
MLQKLKHLVHPTEEFEKVNAQMTKMQEDFSLLKTAITDLSKDLVEMQKNFRDSLNEIMAVNEMHTGRLKTETENIGQLREELQHEVEDFKLQKTRMQQKLLENTDHEVRDGLDRLKTDVNRYNDLKRELDLVNANMAKAVQEINKFNLISQKIKAEDFELTKFAKQIFQADQEKLRLMNEIDGLKHLISRERRAQVRR